MAAHGGIHDRGVGQFGPRFFVDLGHLVGVGLLPALPLEVVRREVVDVVVVLVDHSAVDSGLGLAVLVVETGQDDAIESEGRGS